MNLRALAVDEDDPNGGPADDDQALSIKAFAKYRLLHFERSFASNARFIVYMHNWVTKAVVHGYRKRSIRAQRRKGLQLGREMCFEIIAEK